MIYEANEPSSACRLWRIFQVETSTPPKRPQILSPVPVLRSRDGSANWNLLFVSRKGGGPQFFAENAAILFRPDFVVGPLEIHFRNKFAARPASGRKIPCGAEVDNSDLQQRARPSKLLVEPKASRDAPDQEPSAQSKPAAITAPTPPIRRHRCAERVRTICATASIATPDAPRITK